jgi:uncharacterized protein
VTVYLDTSSVVKLYVSEAGTDVVNQIVAGATIVATSVVAYAETRAALTRFVTEPLRNHRIATSPTTKNLSRIL